MLPFAEYSNSQADVLLAARLTDGLTSELARNSVLGVVSHTSALQFAGTRRPLREIAQALNAELILEGSLHVDGDRLRVEARLVDAAKDRKIWVDDFAGTLTDIPGLRAGSRRPSDRSPNAREPGEDAKTQMNAPTAMAHDGHDGSMNTKKTSPGIHREHRVFVRIVLAT